WSDGSFSFDAVLERYNAELANKYGNLVNRTLTLIERDFDGLVPSHKTYTDDDKVEFTQKATAVEEITIQVVDELPALAATAAIFICKHMYPALKFTAAANEDVSQTFVDITVKSIGVTDSIVWLCDVANNYLTSKAPWKLADDEIIQRGHILYVAAEALRIITALIYPITPQAAQKVWGQLGLGDIEVAAKNGELKNLEWGGLKPGTKLGELGPIFPRADKELITKMNEMEQNNTSAASAEPVAAAPAAVTEEAKTLIGIEDFLKVDLRVAQIKVAERIPKSDKLLRLEVDLGTETRQILAGIAEHYEPEALIGRKVIIVANLAPRKMRGLESQGMLLAASLGDADKPSIAGFLDHVELGARVR
ncbi:MAG TPA: methionine--tRNA ligase subunit beta, partial [Acidobacteriaceae bacterium]|nr:methionine--tRNA ligase subunit beta [Acidobacteriaceae bacterium]